MPDITRKQINYSAIDGSCCSFAKAGRISIVQISAVEGILDDRCHLLEAVPRLTAFDSGEVCAHTESPTVCTFTCSCVLELPYQAMMEAVSILSIMHLWKFVKVFSDMSNLFKLPRKYMHW